jgi:peptidoglycan hydrolase-like protein with peptidoglycan-binding domain
MNLVGRILSTGMQGTDVRRLHDALEKLDFLISPIERTNALFGPGTKKAVQDLQRRHFHFASRVSGMVDQATANLIGTELGRQGPRLIRR